MADLAEVAATFGEVLRTAGLPATPERRARLAQAVLVAQPRTIDQVYWLGRAVMTSSREQIEVLIHHQQRFIPIRRGRRHHRQLQGQTLRQPQVIL